MGCQQLPDPTGWLYVMVHRFVRHDVPMLVQNYETVVNSFSSMVEGVQKPTIVHSDLYLRDRQIKLGWEDVTDKIRPLALDTWEKNGGKWPEGALPWELPPAPPEVERPLPIDHPEEDPGAEVIEIAGEPPKERPTPQLRGAARQVAASKGGGPAGPSVRPRG